MKFALVFQELKRRFAKELREITNQLVTSVVMSKRLAWTKHLVLRTNQDGAVGSKLLW